MAMHAMQLMAIQLAQAISGFQKKSHSLELIAFAWFAAVSAPFWQKLSLPCIWWLKAKLS